VVVGLLNWKNVIYRNLWQGKSRRCPTAAQTATTPEKAQVAVVIYLSLFPTYFPFLANFHPIQKFYLTNTWRKRNFAPSLWGDPEDLPTPNATTVVEKTRGVKWFLRLRQHIANQSLNTNFLSRSGFCRFITS